MTKPIYLDYNATTPVAPKVAEAMVHFLEQVGANPGRSGHQLSIEAGWIVHAAREAVAEVVNVADPLRVVFGANVTEALNLALRGYLRPGDHVVTSSMEHNSVMRPLRALAAGEGDGAMGGSQSRSCEARISPDDPAAELLPLPEFLQRS